MSAADLSLSNQHEKTKETLNCQTSGWMGTEKKTAKGKVSMDKLDAKPPSFCHHAITHRNRQIIRETDRQIVK